ncbi:EAL domain-containing protein [Colwellia sp. C1TZA3]|uniref:EAL domain-containing response regulator n=1 Tax=Colwellia sp. C1TZA3 TaxID=2508879 RepID=UPI0011BA366F|nr:EAL domain-containing response regulator [Colwellia sp. C1TZA3]TWX72759.1 EAL domain-containing response regulator [Colwellia sp. C1TZA3]
MHQMKILVVDDSEVQRNHLINLCNKHGLSNVVSVSNGVLAVDILQDKSFDLVFIDLEMPVMDGITLVREIAKDKLAPAVTILSAKDPALIASIGTMAESDGLSVLGTFKKPMQDTDLLGCIKRIAYNSEKTIPDEIPNRITAKDLMTGMIEKQITLFYQPKLTCKGLLLKGVEALARWQHPKYGHVSPVEFITAAEELDLIWELTYYLFEIVLKQKVKWHSLGINCHIAFNLSPVSLSGHDIVNKIARQVTLYKVDPKEIILEVTENAICREVSDAIETLAKLRLQGFKIAIDDYGTGFANSEQLSRVPATELKLDRILVDSIATRPQKLVILKSSINLARDLGLYTVAEGVESFEDFQLLCKLNINLVQGYYFARPMKPEALVSWLKNDLASIRQDLREKQAQESDSECVSLKMKVKAALKDLAE